MGTSAKLIFFCGKMAAGKSTLARELADRENAILFVQDDLLEALFPGEITDIQAFVQCCSRLKNALTPYICALLSKRISVVLDFAAATKGNIRALDQLLVPAGRDVRHRGSAECGSGSCAGHDNLHHSCDSDRPPSHLNQHCEFVDVSDALCKSQLRNRSKGLPAGAPWTTDADFETINVYFQPPSEDEKFNVVRHERVYHNGA